MSRGASLLAAMSIAWIAGCGAGQPGPATAAPTASAPVVQPGPPLPLGWAPLDGVGFTGRMPAGFEVKTTSLADGTKARVWTGAKDGVEYTVGAPEASYTTAPEETMTASAVAFFKACGGEMGRHRRNDTLQFHTLSVVGTCAKDRPALGEVHYHDGKLEYLFAVVVGDQDKVPDDDVKGFFRAFQVKPS